MKCAVVKNFELPTKSDVKLLKLKKFNKNFKFEIILIILAVSSSTNDNFVQTFFSADCCLFSISTAA